MCHTSHDRQDLRRKALAALQTQVLPRTPPTRTWGGSGSGEPCSVCGCTIDRADMEWELEFAAAEGGTAVPECHLHLRCFTALQEIESAFAEPPPE